MSIDLSNLSLCPNDHIKLRILSARDSEVLKGYAKAWPEYFTDKPRTPAVALTEIRQAEITGRDELQINTPTETKNVMDLDKESGGGLMGGCDGVDPPIPTIEVLFPGHSAYGERGIPATRGLLFQTGDFSAFRCGSTVRIYHATWMVVEFQGPPHESMLKLAPLKYINMDE